MAAEAAGGSVPAAAGAPAEETLIQAVAARSATVSAAARAVRDEAAAAGELVWDPFDPAWVRDPYPMYRRLREENPVHRSPLGFWVFTRHADCLAVLRDRRSSSDGRNANPDSLFSGRISAAGTDELVNQALEEMAPFLLRDPPDHTRLRGLVQKAFTPKMVESLRPRIETICNELLDAALTRGSVDLVADYAYPLPVQIIAEMLGVPVEDHEQFKAWSDALARGVDPAFLLPPEAVQQQMVGLLSFVQYFVELIEQRRRRPGNDLLTRLIHAEQAGDVLSQAELLSTCILLLVAGHETTVNLISGGALALLRHPDALARLRDDPSVCRSGVEELLRFVSPVQLTGRTALEDMEVGGVTVRKGEFSLLLIGSANRDPAVFTRPEELDLTRSENNHLGFGFGIHHCLGAPLARLEAQIALPLLLRRCRHIELAVDTPTYRDNVVLRGLASLPVTVS